MFEIPEIISRFSLWQKKNSFKTVETEGLTKAAVLVPLITYEKEIRILLNRRADHLRDHAGQICFPGGRIDTKDRTPEDTALREAHEEISLLPHHVKIIGRLNQCVTITGFDITPILGHIEPPLSLQLDPLEVVESFEIPLSYILNKDHIQRHTSSWNGQAHSYYVIEFLNYKIWGATASILVNLVQALETYA